MGRRPKNVKITECCGLSTPRQVCLNCDKPKCIYEKGEPRVPIPKLSPDEKYVVKKTRIMIKTGEELTTYLIQNPSTKVNASRHIWQAKLFTYAEAVRAVELCKKHFRLPTTYKIVRKDEEVERINIEK